MNLPLQDMISNVVRNAKEKLAAQENAQDRASKVKQLVSYEKKEQGHIPSPDEEEEEISNPASDKNTKNKTASSELTDEYVEKLASSVEYITAHLGEITPPGPLAQAMAKMANRPGAGSGSAGGRNVPSPVSRAGALETTEAIGGTQKYKRDRAAGTLPEDEGHEPLSGARQTDGKSQLDNNMHDAPGNNRGGVPHTTYPARGPLVAGPTVSSHHVTNQAKLAGISAQAKGYASSAAAGIKNFANRAKGTAKRGLFHPIGQAAQGGAIIGAASGAAGSEKGHRLSGAAKGGVTGGAIGAGSMALARHRATKVASPREVAMDAILSKLAGEDVMKANIDGGGTSSPLAGKGQLQTMIAGETSPRQSGMSTGSGDGNANVKHLNSISAAINMTKRDAKKDWVQPLKEVLDQPAFSPKHDSKLRENLRNAGSAGVKIAGAQTVAELQKIASGGCICGGKNECQFDRMMSKLANMGMAPPGSGMTSTAEAGGAPDGCTCGHTGECRVCKLNAAMHTAKGGQQEADKQ